MPIYEYRCVDCKHEFERLQKISDPPVEVCPKCGKHQVKKLVSQSGFVLKGGGWYKDHYGLKSAAASGADTGNSGSSEANSGSTGSSTASTGSSDTSTTVGE